MDSTEHEIPETEETTNSIKIANSFTTCASSSMLKDLCEYTNNNSSNNSTDAEAMSFVILGNDSREAIQASTLASYVDIQQKSMLVDYNSIVSSMPTNEIHQKLEELLQENTKLKETLRQNNVSMKEKLTKMLLMQETVQKMHTYHKTKFKETTDLINNLKKENLELKTKVVMHQIEDHYEPIHAVSNCAKNTFTNETIDQEEASASSISEEDKNALPNDLKSKLLVEQIQDTIQNTKPIDMVSNFDSTNIKVVYKTAAPTLRAPEEEEHALSNDLKSKLLVEQIQDTIQNTKTINTVPDSDSINISTYEVVSQVLAPPSNVPKEEEHALSNEQQKFDNCAEQKIMEEKSPSKNDKKQIPCEYDSSDKSSMIFEDLGSEIDIKKFDNWAKQKIMEQKLLSNNYKKQVPCEYDLNDECSTKSEDLGPEIDVKQIYSIDKCELNPIFWNDRDYENNRTRYNDLTHELIMKFMKVISRCQVLTQCLRNIVTVLAPVEKAIDEGMFENNLKLKKEFVKYKTEASVYNQLAYSDDDLNYLFFTFCGTLENVKDHTCNVLTDYRETLNMLHLMMDESLKMADAYDNDSHDNSQEQTEIQQKLKTLIIQQSKMQKEKEELEVAKRELDILRDSLNHKKKQMDDVFVLRDQLIRRKNFYDCKLRALLNEKRVLLMREQQIDSSDLMKKYKEKSMECEKLQQQLDQRISDIDLYKSQLSTYEEDFAQEKRLNTSLHEEKSKLNEELRKQVKYNEHLADRLASVNVDFVPESRSSLYSNKEIMPPCPKCDSVFATVQSLTEHIEQCLNLL